MKRKLSWSHVVVGLAVIAALAIAMPAFGVSKSIKKAIKKEVSKQIGKAKGAPGENGKPGADGDDGTARAYVRIDNPCPGPLNAECPFDHAKGVTKVRKTAIVGGFCITAPGIDPTQVTAVASV